MILWLFSTEVHHHSAPISSISKVIPVLQVNLWGRSDALIWSQGSVFPPAAAIPAQSPGTTGGGVTDLHVFPASLGAPCVGLVTEILFDCVGLTQWEVIWEGNERLNEQRMLEEVLRGNSRRLSFRFFCFRGFFFFFLLPFQPARFWAVLE